MKSISQWVSSILNFHFRDSLNLTIIKNNLLRFKCSAKHFTKTIVLSKLMLLKILNNSDVYKFFADNLSIH